MIQSFGLCFDDMVQIDEFIEHAQFHSEAYGDNVIVFISKHYGELKADHEKDHQEEKEDHEKLPFQLGERVTEDLVKGNFLPIVIRISTFHSFTSLKMYVCSETRVVFWDLHSELVRGKVYFLQCPHLCSVTQ